MSLDLDNIDYGVTDVGFRAKTQLAIKNSLLLGLRQYFGSDIGTSSGQAITKFTETFASELALVWSELSLLYAETSAKTASSSRLDEIAEARGLTRKVAAPARTQIRFDRAKDEEAIITGYDGTAVPPPDAAVTVGTADTDIEFYVDVTETMPAYFTFVRGRGTLIDQLSKQGGYKYYSRAQTVIWVSINTSGVPAKVPGTDYVVYTADDDQIEWLGGGGTPADDVIYYVKFGPVSVKVDCTCLTNGTEGNVQAESLTTITSGPTAKFNAVTNESDVRTGSGAETDGQLADRIVKTTLFRLNKQTMVSDVANLEGVRSVRIVEEVGGFITYIDPTYLTTPGEVNYGFYKRALDVVTNTKIVGTMAMGIFKVTRDTVGLYDYFPFPFIGVYGVIWISDERDGSSPYVEGTDYDTYYPNNDLIHWDSGGSPPTGGNDYWIKAAGVIMITEQIVVDVEGTIYLEADSVIADVETAIEADLSSYFDGISSGDDVYAFAVTQKITLHQSVIRLKDFKMVATIRMKRGSGTTDDLPVTGLISIDWINDEADQSGTVYVLTTDYTYGIHPVNNVSWAPAGDEPDTNFYYYIHGHFDGDLLLRDSFNNEDMAPRLGDVTLAEGS